MSFSCATLSVVITDKALELASLAAPVGAAHHSIAIAMPSDALARMKIILMVISGNASPAPQTNIRTQIRSPGINPWESIWFIWFILI
jgi:hypothetical protein